MLLISFLKSFLGSLEQFLAANLASQCCLVHRAHALQVLPEGDTTYCFETLRAKGLLSISATLASGGNDGAVAFLCLPQRQKKDWARMGACTERHLQLIGISRASRRFHVIAEDFRSEVIVPRGNDPLVQEGFSLGLRARNEHYIAPRFSEEEVDAWANKFHSQMPLVRLLRFGEIQWNRLGVPERARQAVPYHDGAAFSPILLAQVYWDHTGCPADRVLSAEVLAEIAAEAQRLANNWPCRAEVEPPSAAKSEQVPVSKALMDWKYINEHLKGNPDCGTRAPQVRFNVDVLAVYSTDMDGDGSEGEDVPIAPRAYQVEELWRPVAIDAVAVHVRSATEVNISLPVAAVILLPEWQWNPSWTQGRLYAGHKKDPTWLVRLISERACDYFKRSERGRALLESGNLITHGTKRHKKQVVDLGEDAVTLRTANSDRAAFCVLVAKDAKDDDGVEPVETEWSHSYIAMGLDLQHSLQTALLFRTYNFSVAAGVLRTIGEILGCGSRQSAMSFPQGEAGAVAKEAFLKAMKLSLIHI